MHPRYNYRRNLPHLQPGGKIFFVTFCTIQRWIIPPAARDIVMETCFRGNGNRYELYSLVVMPDHVHIAFSPLRDQLGWTYTIPDIMQEIKSVSSHRINRELLHFGKVWQEESFDRAMRSAEDVDLKIEYMINNPVRAGLVADPREYRWTWVEGLSRPLTSTRAGAPVSPNEME